MEDTALLRVLIADDLRLNQKAMQDLMRARGFRFHVCPNGREAFHELCGGNWDLAFLDTKMPGMSGMDVARAIRNLEVESGGHLPLIGMATPDKPKEESDCLAAGMDGVVFKPLVAQSVDPVLNEIIVRLLDDDEEDEWVVVPRSTDTVESHETGTVAPESAPRSDPEPKAEPVGETSTFDSIFDEADKEADLPPPVEPEESAPMQSFPFGHPLSPLDEKDDRDDLAAQMAADLVGLTPVSPDPDREMTEARQEDDEVVHRKLDNIFENNARFPETVEETATPEPPQPPQPVVPPPAPRSKLARELDSIFSDIEAEEERETFPDRGVVDRAFDAEAPVDPGKTREMEPAPAPAPEPVAEEPREEPVPPAPVPTEDIDQVFETEVFEEIDSQPDEILQALAEPDEIVPVEPELSSPAPEEEIGTTSSMVKGVKFLEPILEPVPPPSVVDHPEEVLDEADDFINSLLDETGEEVSTAADLGFGSTQTELDALFADETSIDEDMIGTADAPVPEASVHEPLTAAPIEPRDDGSALNRMLDGGMEIVDEDPGTAPVLPGRGQGPAIPVAAPREAVQPAADFGEPLPPTEIGLPVIEELAASTLPAAAVFDREAGLKQHGEDAGYLVANSNDYVLEAMKDIDWLVEAFETGDTHGVLEKVTALGSGAAYLGARQMAALLSRIDQAVRMGDRRSARTDLDLLPEALQLLGESLDDLR